MNSSFLKLAASLFIFATSILSTNANADTPLPAPSLNVCQNFMNCGAYHGTGVQSFAVDGVPKGTKDIEESATVSEAGPDTISFKFSYHAKANPPDDIFILDLKLIFSADGRFTATTARSGLFAIGICRAQNCTFEFVPHATSAEGTNVSTLLYRNGKLIHHMMCSNMKQAGEATSTINAVLSLQ